MLLFLVFLTLGEGQDVVRFSSTIMDRVVLKAAVVEWSGRMDGGFVHGKGTLVIRSKKGEVLLRFKGKTERGDLIKGRLEHSDWTFRGSFAEGAFKKGDISWKHSPLVYEGEWKNGLFHGTGKLIDTRQRVYYQGEFKNGLRHGRGAIYQWALDPEVEGKLRAHDMMAFLDEETADGRLMGYRLVKHGTWHDNVFVGAGGD